MNWAATTIASTHQRREESAGFETIWCMRGQSCLKSVAGRGYQFRASGRLPAR
jgi:hypothetical protein